jgi:hypothetical protein
MSGLYAGRRARAESPTDADFTAIVDFDKSYEPTR